MLLNMDRKTYKVLQSNLSFVYSRKSDNMQVVRFLISFHLEYFNYFRLIISITFCEEIFPKKYNRKWCHLGLEVMTYSIYGVTVDKEAKRT